MLRADTGFTDPHIMTTAHGRVGDFFDEADEDGIEDDDRFSVKSAHGDNPQYQVVNVVDSGIEGSINESGRDYGFQAPGAGHPVTFSGGSVLDSGSQSEQPTSVTHTQQESLQGHPITYSGGSFMGSAPASIQGHPITYSGVSLLDSGNPGSIQGHPITYSGR